MIEKVPFVRYKTDQEKNEEKELVISLKLNEEQQKVLSDLQRVLEQPKQSTAIKQAMLIGAKVILDDKTAYILNLVFGNKRRNKRIGIVDFD